MDTTSVDVEVLTSVLPEKVENRVVDIVLLEEATTTLTN